MTRIDPERRKKLVQRLEQLEASQRATARALGVSHQTIGRDLSGGPSGPPEEESGHAEAACETSDGPIGPPAPAPTNGTPAKPKPDPVAGAAKFAISKLDAAITALSPRPTIAARHGGGINRGRPLLFRGSRTPDF